MGVVDKILIKDIYSRMYRGIEMDYSIMIDLPMLNYLIVSDLDRIDINSEHNGN